MRGRVKHYLDLQLDSFGFLLLTKKYTIKFTKRNINDYDPDSIINRNINENANIIDLLETWGIFITFNS